MKERLIIIGGGVIMQHYAVGLKQSQAVQAVALCDVDEDCPARAAYSDLPFYTDYRTAIEDCKPDGAIIATPVSLHAPIAKDCLQRGLHVYVEKPLCLDEATLEDLYATAYREGKTLTALFHWQYADEVLFLKNYLQGKKIRRIHVNIGDDYACAPKGVIRKDRLGLAGAWLDSGINALSYVHTIVPLDEARLIEKQAFIDKESGLPYYAYRRFLAGGVEVEITVDWTIASRQKTSVIETDEESLFVEHTLQRIERNGDCIFESLVPDRLSSHYKNMFAEPADEDADEDSRWLHKILFLDRQEEK